jgi:hypothetical protein
MPTTVAEAVENQISTPTFERNLRCLGVSSAHAVTALRAAEPRLDVAFAPTPDGDAVVRIGLGRGSRQLCSRVHPRREAEELASGIDIAATPAIVVRGFGAGHHVAAIARRLKRTGVILVYEPDVALLKHVLSVVDHSEWMRETNIAFITDADDTAVMAAAVAGVEAIVALGVKIVDHAPDRARLADSIERFGANFTTVIRSVRTNIVTTLVQVDTTLKNCLTNLEWYFRCPGIADLKDAAKGKPAVIVAAGPSLERNIRELMRPGLRDRCVIIAVQTVLRQLLSMGVRPHFVTALDYAEISRRFYEGLTHTDVEGVELVVESKANPAIFEAYPGVIRMPEEHLLDQALGSELARPMGTIPPGATVAHMAYYLARHLGCDPVILAGQDLGFTDGQYYAAGAAIHRVWASELGEFRTLEMMEWERIVRMRSMLHEAEDVLGRRVYTDEQMTTYRTQFEREFLKDTRDGLRIIDATEGGVRKAHTTTSTLRAALDQHADGSRGVVAIPAADTASLGTKGRRDRVTQRVRQVRADVWRVGDLSAQAARILGDMLEHHADQKRVNRLIAQVHALGDQVKSLEPAHGLVQYLNQTGILNRFKADRLIALDESAAPMERQRRQIERDLKNVQWLAESAGDMGQMLDDTAAFLSTGKRVIRDARIPTIEVANPGGRDDIRVIGIMPVDLTAGPLGGPRNLGACLPATLARALACTGLHSVHILTHTPDAVRALAGAAATDPRVRIVQTDAPPMARRARGLRSARLWSRHCWRGGLGGLSVYDEAFSPGHTARLIRESGAHAGMLLAPEWTHLKTDLCAELIRRFRARSDGDKLLFVQAAPGLGSALLEASLAQQLSDHAPSNGPFASIGALLSYLPFAAQPDPIAKPACVVAPQALRDLAVRCTADNPAFDPALLDQPDRLAASQQPELLTIDAASEHAAARLRDFAQAALAQGITPAITIGAGTDPLRTGHWADLVRAARDAGYAGVHVRTSLPNAGADIDPLLASGADVISIDLRADTHATYTALTGRGDFEAVRGAVGELAKAARCEGEGLPTPWIVPRIARRDATYGEIETFYDRWVLTTGAAVIDPLPGAIVGERIAPLPTPDTCAKARRRATEELCS